MQTNIYRVIHAVLDSPEMVDRLSRRYAYLLNSDKYKSEKKARDILTRIASTHSKPHSSTLKKISSSWRDEMNDSRSLSEISIWMTLPYDHNLLLPYYDSKKS